MSGVIRLKNIMTPIHECLAPEHTLYDAIQFMHRTRWNTVPVTDTSNRLIGVFTRSALHQALLQGTSLDTVIAPLIKMDVLYIHQDTPYQDLDKKIESAKIGTGIVVDDDHKVIGLLTKTDVIFSLLRTTSSLKDQLEEILTSSGLGAIMTDENKQIIYANQKICTITGFQQQELLAHDISVLISTVQLYQMEKTDHYRMQLGNSYVVTRLSRYSTPQENKGYIILFQDVSQVEKMAHELQTVVKWKSILQTVIDNAYDGLIMINELRVINFISPSLLELFGMEESHALHKPIDEVLPHFELHRVMKSGLSEYSDIMEVKGIRYTVHRIPIIQDNEIIGVIGKISFRGLHEMREVVRRLEKSEKESSQEVNKNHETSRFTFDQILTKDPQMEKIIRSAMKTAKGNSTVLIRGESGTGKELFAHAIHGISSRNEGPFVTVNCAAIPEHLLESEFFGYEEGAFSGAKQKGKKGKFDLANGGTLFLDEVGDMSLQLQAKMLRVLQEKEFYRVGGTERIQVNVRIIAATHRSLEEMVKNGEFRNDLFYRLNVISFEIPSLAKRKQDIKLLIASFIQELNRINGTSIFGISPAAEKVLLDYEWPGNVRELRNVMERAMLFCEYGVIEVEDLPDYIFTSNKEERESLDDSNATLMEKAERVAVQKALEVAKGNKSKAAILLGVSRSVLYDRIKKYNVHT
jgi:PAS domain S-box-containing protein